MNVIVTVTLPLVIIFSVPGLCFAENMPEFPSRYPLQSCKSTSAANFRLDSSGSTFEIVRDERNPNKYCLIQTLSDSTRKYFFKKANVDFVSMRDAELTMMIYRFDGRNTRTITCVYPSVALARTFYKDMTQEPRYELVHFMWACYVKTFHDIVLVERPSIFVDCFANYETIAIKNAQDEVVFIFPINAISQIILIGATVNVFISSSPDERVVYKFGFIDVLDASAFRELLNTLGRDTGGTSAQTNRRPYGNSFVEGLFRRLEQQIRDRFRD